MVTLRAVHPIAFHLGGLTVRWYGVMIAVAFLIGLWTAARRAPRAGIPGEKIYDLGLWLIVGGIVGARLFYVVSYPEQVFERPLFPNAPWTEVFMVQRGGLVFYGGLIGASVAGVLFAWARKLPLWKLADVLAPSIALGYVPGRIGCFLNGCCFGRVCDWPWAVRYPPQSDVWQRHFDAGLTTPGAPSAPVHPTQLYDALLSLALYVGLAVLFRRRRFDGQIFATYLMGYAIQRSWVELFRGDYPPGHLHAGFTPAHLWSLVALAAGATLFWTLQRAASKRG